MDERATVFPHTLKSLLDSLGCITKPRWQSLLLLSQFTCQSWIWKPHNCLMLAEFNRDSWKSHRIVGASCVTDRSHGPSLLSPLSTFLTNRCQLGHRESWDCDGGIIGNLNLSLGASGPTAHKHHLRSQVFSSFILLLIVKGFLLPGSGRGSLWLLQILFANPESGIWWWQCQE